MRLTSRELQATLDFIRELYVLRDLDAFVRHVVTALPRLVPADHTSFNEVNPRLGRNRGLNLPEIPRDLLRVFEDCMNEHPLIRYYERTPDGAAVKISDFLSLKEFHRLSLYNEFFRVVDVEHQMAFVLPAPPPLVVGIALNRGRRDFSESERATLNLLRPHVVEAYHNAEVVTRLERELALITQGEERLGRGVIIMEAEGRVRLQTSRARRWLAEYFGSVGGGECLPDTLRRWVRHEQSLLAGGDDVPLSHRPLVVEQEGKRLEVRLLSERDSVVLVLEERTEPTAPALERLGLSRREAEVLSWVAQGKTNPEIATILGTRPRTVSKQLEYIYEKLRVENRTAAARAAVDFLSSAPS